MISEFISLVALLVSALVFWDSRRFNKSEMRLTEQEVELVRHQLVAIRQGVEQEKTASVSARTYKDGKNWRVKVYNQGPADARNVRLVLDENNSIVTPNAIEGKLPMDRMEKGQSVDFWARVHLQTQPKEMLTIRWDDPSGANKENRVTLTI